MAIYRYRRPTEYLMNEIVDGQIYFAPILEMNDFYDGYFRYTSEGDLEKYIEITTSQIKEHAEEILARSANKTEVQQRLEEHSGLDSIEFAKAVLYSPDYLKQTIEQLRIDFRENPEKIQETVKVQNENANTMRQLISICCFSRKKLDMSMFGYYAEYGKGVMIEYSDTMNIARDVNYLDKLPYITIDKTFPEILEMQVFNKLTCWSHEQEVRTYIYAEDRKRTDHGMKIENIYLGPRTDLEFTNKVTNWANSVNVPVIAPTTDDLGRVSW